jgi:hypothetical protein
MAPAPGIISDKKVCKNGADRLSGWRRGKSGVSDLATNLSDLSDKSVATHDNCYEYSGPKPRMATIGAQAAHRLARLPIKSARHAL